MASALPDLAFMAHRTPTDELPIAAYVVCKSYAIRLDADCASLLLQHESGGAA